MRLDARLAIPHRFRLHLRGDRLHLRQGIGAGTTCVLEPLDRALDPLRDAAELRHHVPHLHVVIELVLYFRRRHALNGETWIDQNIQRRGHRVAADRQAGRIPARWRGQRRRMPDVPDETIVPGALRDARWRRATTPTAGWLVRIIRCRAGTTTTSATTAPPGAASGC